MNKKGCICMLVCFSSEGSAPHADAHGTVTHASNTIYWWPARIHLILNMEG